MNSDAAKKKRLPLLIALVAGVAAVVLFQEERAKWKAEAGVGPTQAIVVVDRALKTGAAVEEASLGTREVPLRYIHPLSLAPSDLPMLTGARVARALKPGQPLLWSDLADPAAGDRQVASLVRPNERAISLRVNEMNGVGRLIRNNDHVDIFGTFQRRGETVTVPVLQNVVVIATGQNLAAGGHRDYRTLSVSVSPQEAALLTLAQETGRLTYVLRNSHDFRTAEGLKEVSMSDLFEDGKRDAVQKQRNIRVLKGKL